MTLARAVVTSALTAAMASGCAVVWGGAYRIDHSDQYSVVIHFDPSLTDTQTLQRIADMHCGTYDRYAPIENTFVSNLYLGIQKIEFLCVDKAEHVWWAASGGSKSDGVVRVSYLVDARKEAIQDSAQARRVAVSRCKIWGFEDADAFDFISKTTKNGITTATQEFQCR